ncbi:MAG: phosphate ABC transporter permease PstA [Coriobacteriia bacterium]|nr:phosphate ABC transporter permease PstA [Coriobacteriia bacterium]
MEAINDGGRHTFGSRVGTALCWIASAIVAVVCLWIIGYLFWQGWHAINWAFLTTDPDASLLENHAGGIRTPMVGTTILVLFSILIALPLAIGAAIYLSEYMDERWWITRIVRIGLETLASVPSVVFGMFGLAVFTMSFFKFLSASGTAGGKMAFGRSFIVASIVMGIHILPFVIKVTEESIRNVPANLRQGAYALGMTKWRTISKVVLPAARSGIATAVVLGMGLAAGDTAIVWLTLGGSMTMAVDKWWQIGNWLPVLKGAGSTLTTYAYFNSAAGDGNSPVAAFGAAFVLICIVLIFNLAAALIFRRNKMARR